MCGRARLITDYSEIRIELKFDDDGRVPNYAPRWNIAPSEDLLVAIRDADGKRRPALMRWGLIPGWAKDTKIAFSTFNARAESVDTKPAFRGAWKAGRRCLVVTDGFYEWRKAGDNKDGQPFAVGMADGRLMVMAGLYEDWTSPGGETVRTVTVITTPANAAIAPSIRACRWCWTNPTGPHGWAKNRRATPNCRRCFAPARPNASRCGRWTGASAM